MQLPYSLLEMPEVGLFHLIQVCCLGSIMEEIHIT